MSKLAIIVLSCLFAAALGSDSDDSKEKECMAWALNRIVGVPFREKKVEYIAPRENSTVEATTTLPPLGGAFGPYEPVLGRGKPGKQGAPGPRGEEGPQGPPGICQCNPEDVKELRRQNADLTEKLTRIRLTSPETLCLLGMKDGSIPDDAITVSSTPSHATYARLDGVRHAWWPGSLNAGREWIMVDIGKVRLVTGVVTQGRYDSEQWVTGFQVEHSANGNNFTDILKTDGSEMVFTGNSDRHTKVVNRFPAAVETRYVRIYPMTYKSYMSMRFDIIDC